MGRNAILYPVHGADMTVQAVARRFGIDECAVRQMMYTHDGSLEFVYDYHLGLENGEGLDQRGRIRKTRAIVTESGETKQMSADDIAERFGGKIENLRARLSNYGWQETYDRCLREERGERKFGHELIPMGGEMLSGAQCAEKLGISRCTFYYWMRKGLTADEIARRVKDVGTRSTRPETAASADMGRKLHDLDGRRVTMAEAGSIARVSLTTLRKRMRDDALTVQEAVDFYRANPTRDAGGVPMRNRAGTDARMTISEATKMLGLGKNTFAEHMKKTGDSFEETVEYYRDGSHVRGKNRFYELNGERVSATGAAKKLGVSRNAIMYRMKKGMSFEEACASCRVKTTTLDGEKMTVSAAARKISVKETTLHSRIQRNKITLQQAADELRDGLKPTGPHGGRPLHTLDGAPCKVADAAAKLGVCQATIWRMMKQYGMTLQGVADELRRRDAKLRFEGGEDIVKAAERAEKARRHREMVAPKKSQKSVTCKQSRNSDTCKQSLKSDTKRREKAYAFGGSEWDAVNEILGILAQ